jgi:hypothetical protein
MDRVAVGHRVHAVATQALLQPLDHAASDCHSKRKYRSDTNMITAVHGRVDQDAASKYSVPLGGPLLWFAYRPTCSLSSSGRRSWLH